MRTDKVSIDLDWWPARNDRDHLAVGKIKWCVGRADREVSLIDLSFTSIRQVKEGQIFQSLMKASTSWGLYQDVQRIWSGWWSALAEAAVLLIWICDMAVYLLLHNPWNVSQKAAQLIFNAFLLFGHDASNWFWKKKKNCLKLMCIQKKRIFHNTSWKFWLSLRSSKEPESDFTSNYQQLNYNWAAQNGYNHCNRSYLLSKMKRTCELCGVGYPRLKTFDSDSSHFRKRKLCRMFIGKQSKKQTH